MVSVRSVLAFTPVCTFLFALPAAAQGSDACATPQVVAGAGPHAFNLTGATTGTQGQAATACNINGSAAILNDVWFRWTAPATGTFLASTCQQTSVDTKIAVYAGVGCPAAAPLWCDDDWGGAQALAYFNATSGQTFTIQLGVSPVGTPGTGSGTFRVLQVPTGAADACGSAAPLGSATGFVGFDCSFAGTGTQGQSNPGCTTNPDDIWYTWTAPITGMAHLDTCGQTTADTRIAVYAGVGCPAATSLACDDDGCNLQSITQWPVTGGSMYTLQVSATSVVGGVYGTFRLEVTGVPANDSCSSPVSGGSTSYDNTLATTGTQGQSSPCGPIEKDLWFTWTATVNGTATIDTCGQTALDTIIAVYPGSGCPSGTALACNDDGCAGGIQSEVSIPITTGLTYTIQVGTPPGGQAGASSFSIVQTPSGSGPMTPICFPGQGGAPACPCGNPPTSSDRGCDNFGAGPVDSGKLEATGVASLGSDTVVLSASGENNTSLTVFWQGRDPLHPTGGIVHAAGVRCVTTTLKRLYTGIASGGAISRPAGADPSVSARSAAVGDTIVAGQNRHYFTIYRDPQAAGPCGNTASTVNLTTAGTIPWGP